MVVGEAEGEGEVESPLRSEQTAKSHHALSSLGRQSSIYSLTLDEFQHTLCDGGKNFGSMNMDEFLTSIWNAEENQTFNSSQQQHTTATSFTVNEASGNDRGIRKQPSLSRQGSLTIPPPLCRKTVEEVWSEIHRSQHNNDANGGSTSTAAAVAVGNATNFQNPESAPRQPTFGEMTLEDFLIKAGVVRESGAVGGPPAQQQQYGLYPDNKSSIGPAFVGRPVMGNVVSPYQAVGEPSGFGGNGKRDGGYHPAPPPSAAVGLCYGERVVNGGGGYRALSPVSSDGLGGAENCGMEMRVMRGRKRMMDSGGVEKVVERRQRRMIKNRESAARSRARKQAYTVELEAELNQLREENSQLKHALVELERRRKQQCLEEMNNNMRVQTKAQKAKNKLRTLRRNQSCP